MITRLRTAGVMLAVLAGVYLLYFHGAGRRGAVGPDEPRYAAVAWEMAESGDWVTPHLWGEPWFEKPALLYWMGAAAQLLGASPDLATRLPVAALSAGFLAFFYWRLRREFGHPAAGYSTAILATTAGWVAFSQAGIFDLPLAAAVGVALLTIVPLAQGTPLGAGRQVLLGVSLGIALLAKGLVGPVLAGLALTGLPPRHWRHSLKQALHPRVLVSFLLVGGSWYGLCYSANGAIFIEEFFWRHHIERFFTSHLQHEQPFWYFVPVLLAGFSPWVPLLVPVRAVTGRPDPRRRFFAIWALSAFVFFSLSNSKLPGYLMPLLPPLAALAGIRLAQDSRPFWRLFAAATLLLLLPVAETVLPGGLSRGLSRAWPPESVSWTSLIVVVGTVAAVAWTGRRGRTTAAFSLLVLGAVASWTLLKVAAFPAIDRVAGTRVLWQRVEPVAADTCIGAVRRHVQYGLRFYSRGELPLCSDEPRPNRIEAGAASFL